uniref:Uncharacterized protein n=1 Tax=Oryza brachyantha TaxID=4533 RepID=J3MB98_ORYBR
VFLLYYYTWPYSLFLCMSLLAGTNKCYSYESLTVLVQFFVPPFHIDCVIIRSKLKKKQTNTEEL